MFYITTPQGISISESGRAPLFIGRDHEEFANISKNIKNMSYNDVQEAIDIKSKIIGFVNEDTETYINSDDDLEMQLNLENIKDSYKKDVCLLARTQIMGDKDEDELNEKEKRLINLIEKEGLKLVGIKLIFE